MILGTGGKAFCAGQDLSEALDANGPGIEKIVREHYNPIINSSSLIRREYCQWELNDINFAMDDYHLWMKMCLSNKKLYNIPEYLVWHRIHKTSAFNSQGQTNDALRAWYKNARITASNKSD